MNFINEVVSSSYDIRDYTLTATSQLPEAFSLPSKVPVKNQGFQSTCVAHAAASLIEYHYKRQHNNCYRAFSTEFIYGTRPTGYYVGDGMVIRDALKTLTKYGDCFKADCPGNHGYEKAIKNVSEKESEYRDLAYPHRISTYYRVTTENEIKTALIKHGPVLVSMNTYEDSKIVDDIYTYDTSRDHGRHCVMIYGWDERGWLIQNSWGTIYAGDGRFVIPFEYQFNEAWGVTDEINDLTIKKTNKFLTIIYKIYNKIINWYIKITDKT